MFANAVLVMLKLKTNNAAIHFVIKPVFLLCSIKTSLLILDLFIATSPYIEEEAQNIITNYKSS